MGKRHHGKGEANGTSALRGRDGAAVGAMGADAADAGVVRGDARAAGSANSAAAVSTNAARSVDAASAAHAAAQPSSAPFFSIVLPTYSSEPYLAAALGEMQDQLFTDRQAIVVNHC